MKILFVAALILSSCAVMMNREPTQADTPVWGEVVKSGKEGARFCPQTPKGSACLMNWADAMKFCESQNAHLPTAREYVNLLMPLGVKVLEKEEVEGAPPAGYYLVDSRNPDGSLDGFYMNHSEYRRPLGETENYLLWTSSIPPSHPKYAHVYYTEWGGGGGDPKDHLLTHKNAIRCVKN